MKKIYSLLLIALVLMVAVTGCTNSANTEPKGKLIFRETNSSIGTLNQQVYNNTAESQVLNLINGNLLDLVLDAENKTYKFAPMHAEALPTKNDDGTVWTFKLRKDNEWSDGTPITAHTYEYTYKILMDPKLANRRGDALLSTSRVVNGEKYLADECDWSEVGVKATDDNTLVITLEQKVTDFDFMSIFAGGGSTSPIKQDLYEKCFNDDKTENTYGTSVDTTPSSGPYKLVEWTRDKYREYVKNANYGGSSHFVPEIITEQVTEDSNTKVQLFETGETDYTSISGSDFDKYEDHPGLIYASSTSIRNMYINTLSDKKFLADVNFRRAMFHAMPRKKIAEDIYKTHIPANYYISSAKVANLETKVFFRDTEQGKANISPNNGLDLEYAKECFDKAYKANGSKKMEVELLYFEDSNNMKVMAEVIEEEFEVLFGSDKLDIQLKGMPWRVCYEQLRAKNFDMGFGGWAGSRLNPYSGMKVYLSTYTRKHGTFANDEYDKLYEEIMDATIDPDTRLDKLARMEKIMLEELNHIPLYEGRTPYLFSDRVHLLVDEYVPGVGFAMYEANLDPMDIEE